VLVVMIGTNDAASNSRDEIAAGIEKLVREIRQRLPNMKILLLGIFPRGPHTSNTGKFDDGLSRMLVIRAANARIAKLDDGRTVRYLDIGEKFLDHGKIPDDVMADQLHPTAKGYQRWADAMQPLLEEMLR
jgi:beta-glucosidase